MRTSILDSDAVGSSDRDHEARFDRIFDEHARAVLAYCQRRTTVADAQDALSEVFVVVWRRLNDVPVSGTRPWLYGVARRILANQRRSDDRRQKLAEVVSVHRPRTTPTAESESMRRRQDEVVVEAVSRLPDKDREVLTLIAWEGLSRAEAAQVAGCSPEAAKKRYQRAVNRLRDELAPMLTASARPDPRSAPEGGD